MTDHWYIGWLETNPNVAAALGQYVADFAAIEYWMLKMLALTLRDGENLEVAQALFGHVRSITERCKMLKASAAAANLPNETREKIVAFAERIDHLNARRNELIHGVWESNPSTGEVRMAPAALSASRKKGKVAQPITAADIHGSVLELRRFTVELVQALFQTELRMTNQPST